jgi:malonyl-CoA/methylmalonyl-CoA synthetase
VSSAPLIPRLADPDDGEAIRVGGESLSYRELRDAAAGLAAELRAGERVGVWATPSLGACVSVVASLAAGATVVPVNPGSGTRELEHIVGDSGIERVLAGAGESLPDALDALPRVHAEPASGVELPDALEPSDAAIILYTSGTTGPPKGAVIPRLAIESNLDALAEVWEWTGEDRLAHALPLFHVHGLVLGVLGPLRRGGQVEHVGRFSPAALAAALAERGATMVFGVPTMYNRVALEAADDADVASAFGGARLLVSGSAPLPATLHSEFERLTGQRIVERYGMTETLMNVAVRAAGERVPGYVGLPLPGVEVRLVDDDGGFIEVNDDETIGELVVSGPNVFAGYLNRPDATAEALRDGWFYTGDMATRRGDGYIRIVGRRATDLIKSGGYKIGAGEIESALLEHPAVAEVAVAGRPDADLGERIVAWVVRAPDSDVGGDDLVAHVGTLLSGHKRPREVVFVDELPRNEMGKVMKKRLEV